MGLFIYSVWLLELNIFIYLIAAKWKICLLLPMVQFSTSTPAYSFCGSRTIFGLQVFLYELRNGFRQRVYHWLKTHKSLRAPQNPKNNVLSLNIIRHTVILLIHALKTQNHLFKYYYTYFSTFSRTFFPFVGPPRNAHRGDAHFNTFRLVLCFTKVPWNRLGADSINAVNSSPSITVTARSWTLKVK